MYRKGQPTATSILIYEDSRGEVVQQCIANLMSTFHLYPHSEVIAISFTDQFEDLLRWLHKTDKPNRDTCKNWRAWSREKFVEHLRLLYPQLSNAADKSYLEMIKKFLFNMIWIIWSWSKCFSRNSPRSLNSTTLSPLRKRPRQ